MPTILDRKLSQNRKKQSGVSLFRRIDSMFGRFFASSKSENKKNEKLVSSELYVVRNKKTMSLTYDRFLNGCSRVGSSFIHLLLNMSFHLLSPNIFICLWNFHFLVENFCNNSIRI